MVTLDLDLLYTTFVLLCQRCSLTMELLAEINYCACARSDPMI